MEFHWNNYEIYRCKSCKLNFCPELINSEGNSSPVDEKGVEMMAKSYYLTKNIAYNFALKRSFIYKNILKRNINNILDIGCGPGVFYEPYKSLSIKWKGLEVNPFWVDFGKKNNIPIFNEEIDKLNEKFDVVTAHQVLEHVGEPLIFIKKIYKILNPGGVLYFELPNDKSLTANLRKISPYLSNDFGFIQPPMHMRAYTKHTIEKLFKTQKFQIHSIFSCSNNNSLWGQVRKYSIFQKFFFNFAASIKMGSLLIGIARKENE